MTEAGDVVLDLFLDSKSTLNAAENTGRRWPRRVGLRPWQEQVKPPPSSCAAVFDSP
jgi:hypothetical protein